MLENRCPPTNFERVFEICDSAAETRPSEVRVRVRVLIQKEIVGRGLYERPGKSCRAKVAFPKRIDPTVRTSPPSLRVLVSLLLGRNAGNIIIRQCAANEKERTNCRRISTRTFPRIIP